MGHSSGAGHIPVLVESLIASVAPVHGVWIDGTLGAGGHSRALLDAGADAVIAIDRDPDALEAARGWVEASGGRARLVAGKFSSLDEAADAADGVVLDLGVSSMQLDSPERGFSFMRDGPLDMRMGRDGETAADIVNGAPEAELADIIFRYGEERAARRIARAIMRARAAAPVETTGRLAGIVEQCMPAARGRAHPATRTFMALRIAVNAELEELVDGMEAAERVLSPGGRLAVVTFHSIEDRIVKRFMRIASGGGDGGSRFLPRRPGREPRFELRSRSAVKPDEREIARNPRARSAKLRVAVRTAAAHERADRAALGLPRNARRGR